MTSNIEISRKVPLRVPEDGQVVARLVDGEVIIINFNTGIYFTLGGSGVDFWPLLETGSTIDAMGQWAAERWGLPAMDLLDDFETICLRLHAEGLVVVLDEVGPFPSPPARTSEAYTTPTFDKFDDLANSFAVDPPLPMIAIKRV